MNRLLLSSILLLMCLFVTSCGPKVIRLTDTVYSQTSKIELLKKLPTDKEFDKIALLIITDQDYFNTKQMMRDLKEEAMRLGADALVLQNIGQVDRDYSDYGYYPGHSSASSYGVIEVRALAIRYTSVKAQPIKKALAEPRVEAEMKPAVKEESKRMVSKVDVIPPAREAPPAREVRPVEAETKVTATEEKTEIVASTVGKTSFVEDALPAKEVPPAAEMRPAGNFTINVASFKEEERANVYVEALQEKGVDAFQWEFNLPGEGSWYRVSVGAFPTRQEAKNYMEELRQKGIHNTFIARIPRPQ